MSIGDRDTIATSAMAQAWRAAALDLGVRFESPFSIEHEGSVYWCEGWLPGFGCHAGAIIAGRDAVDEILDIADSMGFLASGLNPECYEVYERAHFIETLNDWGWFGDPASAPQWFAGGFNIHGGPPNPALQPPPQDRRG